MMYRRVRILGVSAVFCKLFFRCRLLTLGTGDFINGASCECSCPLHIFARAYGAVLEVVNANTSPLPTITAVHRHLTSSSSNLVCTFMTATMS
ncbi:hypothetical protein K469DRAFT_321742 [Zopfia rhizophila CBS 207.26]|uniref:Secreted protein n=1 Tax=Zopfia rhizophila CBS 207.26 TaxID=1314779 RepID=A0A6A6DJE4_9PEZI|nr:hypothetical protein K469DRAFT_321742 [Zopfia rhizophila CBS 207.26]